VVNRPTSPFVSGLAAEEGCSQGGFARFTYGTASVSAATNNGVSTQSNTADATYQGLQAGWDYGCNDGRFFDGWDGSFGATVGYNTGSTDQNVFVADGVNSTLLTSITHTDFDQRYIGAYGAISKDRLTADVQLRLEKTEFELNETEVGGNSGLGLSDSTFETDSVNITGRVSYRLDLNDDGLNFVPTGGLSLSHPGDILLQLGRRLYWRYDRENRDRPCWQCRNHLFRKRQLLSRACR
jgi:hypothetical protein